MNYLPVSLHRYCLCIVAMAAVWFMSVRDVVAQDGVTLTFNNQTQDNLKVFWVDRDGNEKAYGEIKPGESRNQDTYAGDTWVFRVGRGNTLLVRYTARRSDTLWIDAKGNIVAGEKPPRVETPRPIAPAGGAPANVTLILKNESAGEVKIFWVDPNGKEVAYGSLRSGTSSSQATSPGHNWVYRSAESAVVGRVTATEQDQVVRIDARGNFAVTKANVNPQGLPIVPTPGNPEEASFTLRNDSAVEVKYFWLNPNGEEVLYKSIKSGEVQKQLTAKGHQWLIRSAADNKELGRFTAGGNPVYTINPKLEFLGEASINPGLMPPTPEIQTARIDHVALAQKDPNFLGHYLIEGAWLSPNQYLLSFDGLHKFHLSPAGQLMISKRQALNEFKLLWITETASKGFPRLSMQPDGNLVLYDFADAGFTRRLGAIWESGAKPEVIAQVAPQLNGKCFVQFERAYELRVLYGKPGGAVTQLWTAALTSETNPVYRKEMEDLRRLAGQPAPVPRPLTARTLLGNPPVKPGEKIRSYGSSAMLTEPGGDNTGYFQGSLRDGPGLDADSRPRPANQFGGNTDKQGRMFDLHIVQLKSEVTYKINVSAIDNAFPPVIVLEDGNGDRIAEVGGISFKPADYGIKSGPVRLIVRTDDKQLVGHYKLRISPPAEKAVNLPSEYTTQNQVGKGNILRAGEFLESGEFLASADGVFRATMQPDGNLVIRQAYGDGGVIERLYWASNTTSGKARLAMQSDGNLAIRPVSASGQLGEATWQTGMVFPPGARDCYVKLLESGNLAIYGGRPLEASILLWHTDPSKRNLSAADKAAKDADEHFELPAPNRLTAASRDALSRAPKLFSQAAEAALRTMYELKNYDDPPAKYTEFSEADKTWIKRLGLKGNPKVTYFRHWKEKDITFMVASDDDNVILAFRGTESKLNWEQNGVPKSLQGINSIDNARPVSSADFDGLMVHRGWESDLSSVWSDIDAALEEHQAKYKTVAITGHSLGGALAGYTTYRLLRETKHLHPAKQHVLATFAAPRFAYKTTDGAPILRGFEFLADLTLNGKGELPVDAKASDFKESFYNRRRGAAPNLVVYTIEARGATDRVDWVTVSWDPAGLVENALGFDKFFKKIANVEPTRDAVAKVLGSVETLGPVIEIPSAYQAGGNLHNSALSYLNVLEAYSLLQRDPKRDWFRP